MDIVKKNIKIFIVLGVIILLGTIGVSLSAVFGYFNIGVNTKTGVIDAEITYDEDINGSNVVSNGNMLPIDDELVSLTNNDDRIFKAVFYVSGNSDDVIYDIALHNSKIDYDLKTKDLKWKLYKESELISSGNLFFDSMSNESNRLVLTNKQEDLGSTATKYTFMLWISESCTGNITECDSSLDQSKYLNKTLSADIKLELSTRSKSELVRIIDSVIKLTINY